VAGGGGKGLPAVRGQSVPAMEAGMRIFMAQTIPNDRIVLFANGGFYEFKDGNLTCLLAASDYKDAAAKYKGAPTEATLGLMGGDGTFYVGFYYGAGKLIVRISADGGKAEPYVQDTTNSRKDGPAMKSGFFCGPHLVTNRSDCRFIAPDIVIPSTHDDSDCRRVKDGRVSTLCMDGEWREVVGKGSNRPGPQDPAWWFRAFSAGPDGTVFTYGADMKNNASWSILNRVTGIDWGKPTVGPKAE
jgi:hypothetical protein